MTKAIPVTVQVQVDAIESNGQVAILSARLIDTDGTELATIATQRVEKGSSFLIENVFAVPRTTGVGDSSIELVFELPGPDGHKEKRGEGKGEKHPVKHK